MRSVNRSLLYASLFMLVLSLPVFVYSTWGQLAQTSSQISHLKVEASPLKLNAGHNTSVIFLITNNFEPIYDLDVTVQFPSSQLTAPPIILGSNHWKFSKLKKGENISFPVVIYASDDTAGQGFSAIISLVYKRLGYISPYMETHIIGFYAKGFIDMVMYDLSTDPDPAIAGEILAISANILNKGNVPAMFTNVSLASNPAINLKPESYSYLGQVDPNSPAPFTVEANVNPELKPGEYVLKLLILYEDDELVPHRVERDFTITVTEAVTYTPPTTSEKIVGAVQRWTLPIAVGASALIIGVVISLKRRRSGVETES
ncbi:MAG: hypothetical protein QXO32_08160 [Candidatus Bathyarchaeia archaeon]